MSKQSTNIARICASVILGFTQVSFAATTEPTLMDIPPPPILRGPPAGSQAQTNTTTYNTGNNNTAAAAVGTSKVGSTNNAPSAAPMEKATSSQGLFGKANNGVSATSTQSDNANAVNAATIEAAKKAAAAATPTGVMWGTQIFPAANTMYSTPQRK